jgi:hypothetical protein
LRSRLDAIIDMGRPLVKLVRTLDWPFLEQKFGAVYENPQLCGGKSRDGLKIKTTLHTGFG